MAMEFIEYSLTVLPWTERLSIMSSVDIRRWRPVLRAVCSMRRQLCNQVMYKRRSLNMNDDEMCEV
jgi:hypothetical protein